MLYFAYGANLNKRIMRERCPGARPLRSATLPNHRLVFAGWSREWKGGVATVRPVRGEKVLGGVWEVDQADMTRLDREEGYPTVHIRVNVRVFDDGGAAIDAMTYVKVGQEAEAPPSKEYRDAIAQGYRDWGLI